VAVGTTPSGTPLLARRGCDTDQPTQQVIYGGGKNGTAIVYRFHSVALVVRSGAGPD
jgi:hypothetical protein